MMKDNVDYLPIWKEGATAEERLLELAMIARKHPERFDKFVIGYQESFEDGATKTRYMTFNTETISALGLLRMVDYEILEFTRR